MYTVPQKKTGRGGDDRNQFLLTNVLVFLMFICLFLKERESREEGERETQAGSALSAQNLTQSSNSGTMRSYPEPKPRVGRLTN